MAPCHGSEPAHRNPEGGGGTRLVGADRSRDSWDLEISHARQIANLNLEVKLENKTEFKCAFAQRLGMIERPGTVPRPSLSDAELDQVADLLRQGRFLSQIAGDLGWEQSKVKRAVNHLRVQVAVGSGRIWLDVKEKSPVAVALEWIRLRSQPISRT